MMTLVVSRKSRGARQSIAMPYITLHANGREVVRHNLGDSIIIGRAPECDVMVRDILLSRRHCRIESIRDGWRIIDLDSRNGTRLGQRRVKRHLLREGESIRLGRTELFFHEGACAADTPRETRLIRPADPFEALEGTVAGLLYVDPDEQEASGETPVDGCGDEDIEIPALDNTPAARPTDDAPGRYGAQQAMLIQLAADVAAWRRKSVHTAVLARGAARSADLLPRRPLYIVLPGRNLTLATVNRRTPDLSLQVTPDSNSSVASPRHATPSDTASRSRLLLATTLSLMIVLATLLVMLCGALPHAS